MKSLSIAVLAILTAGLVAGCGGGASLDTAGSAGSSGGGGNPPSGSNVQPISVNLGPTGNYANGIFTSVTICSPASPTTCQTIPNVLVDTGSYGLRLLGSVINSNISLPQQTIGAGSTAECTVFGDGYAWGPVVTADIQIAGETASNVLIQVIAGPSSFTPVPAACSQTAATDDQSPQQDDNTLALLGANGILGIGPLAQDCGSYCEEYSDNDQYFTCSSSVCTSTTQSPQTQVQNPVPLFTSDNNGVQIQLPAISAGGAATASGVLIFGIETQANNALGSAQVLTADSTYGYITTAFNGTPNPYSFIDSGSNSLGFTDSTIPQCPGGSGFYCPSSPLSLSATMEGQNGASVAVPFSVVSPATLSANNAAFNDLAGTILSGYFDWGLPFFYGRNVYFAIEGGSAPGGTPPYYAFVAN